VTANPYPYLYLAAPEGPLFGSVGAGGLSLVLWGLLFFGIRKGGKTLPTRAVLVIAFAAGVMSVAAAGIWAYPSAAVENVLSGLTGQSSQLGDIGPGAIALLITTAVWYSDLNAKWTAIWGYAAAVVYGAAGGIWLMPIELIRTAFASVGL